VVSLRFISAMSGTYVIETLGCKANFYDSRRLAETLEDLGFRPARPGEEVSVCVLNTCTVTATADRKGRQQAGRLARAHPDARLFVTGCYAEARPDELAEVAGVEGVYGRTEWAALLEAINGAALPPGAPALEGDFGIRAFGGRARAFLKIQEGCDSFCSYCVLPRVRGAPRSRPLGELRAEARRLAEAGFAEIVLTGIHLGLYGRELAGRPTLAQALRDVSAVQGLQRVRLSSVECNEVDAGLLEAMQHPAVCPHLHLPLQSGDAEVLRRMSRRYGPEDFLRAVEMARACLQRPAITTDVMVGFPGETEEQFARTMDLCGAVGFSRLHVFPFSPRPGTAAAGMDGRVGQQEMRERGARLRGLGNRLAAEWAEGFVGRRVRVLFERRAGEGRLVGYTDRYVRLTARADARLLGRVVRLTCTGRRGMSLIGEIPAQDAATPAGPAAVDAGHVRGSKRSD
jgi:threonylcarbamoyladenosine tRNA methylthiotransferase MtaB